MANNSKSTKRQITNSSTVRPKGFWSTQTLKARLGSVIEPYDKTRTHEAVHRLSMGREYYVTRDAMDPGSTRDSSIIFEEGEAFAIPPGHFGFLITEETITMPIDAIGFITIQTDIKFLGLVNISGFHVDPGSDGKLIFAVFNAGPNPVHLKQGDAIFRLWMASLDELDKEPRKGKSHQSIPSEIVNGISGSLESLQSLSRGVENVNRRIDTHITVIKLVAGIVGAIFAAVVGGMILAFVSGFFEINIKTAPVESIEEQKQNQASTTDTSQKEPENAPQERPENTRQKKPE